MNMRSGLSADAILPLLIYAIIKSNPAKLVSHFNYIQRFRAQSLLDGELAYCLTNLEAAISFLESVDLHRLGLHEDSAKTLSKVGSQTSISSVIVGNSPALSGRSRLLSSAALEVYENVDERMKSLGTALDSSYKLLVGKMTDRVSSPPKNIEDVRTLMGLRPDDSQAPSIVSFQEIKEKVQDREREKERTKLDHKSLDDRTTELRRNADTPELAASNPPPTTERPTFASLGRLGSFGMMRNLSFSRSSIPSYGVPPSVKGSATTELASVPDALLLYALTNA